MVSRWSKFRVLVNALMIGIICCSCSITRTIPEDKLLLQSVDIPKDKTTPKDERIPTTTLVNYVRQSANKRLFGFNFYIWVYLMSNPDKDNWWNNFKRKVGEKPVYLDLASTETSCKNIKLYMNSQGYYASETEFKIDTSARRRRAHVTYTTRQGKPYIISGLKYQFLDTQLTDLIESDTTNSYIHKGDVFSVALLDMERDRIARNLRNRGYYNFTVNNISYRADTLAGNNTVGLEMVIKKELTGYDNRGNAEYRNNIRYRVGKVNIVPNFDPSVMINDSSYMSKVDSINFKALVRLS